LQRVPYYTEFDGTVHEIEFPISRIVDPKEIRNELGLPDYLDLSNPVMERAEISIWAARNAPTLFPDLAHKKTIQPIPSLLIGGGAVRMLSPSANDPSGPFQRRIHDLDFIVPKNQGSKFVLLLSQLGKVAGTRYHYFLTESDTMFNALRSGERYRIRALDWDGNDPKVVETDIFVERLRMKHIVQVSEEFNVAREKLYTIGLDKLILSKVQLIADLEESDLQRLERAGQAFRILPYKYNKHVIIGMEGKDILDVCALFHDHGTGVNGLSPANLVHTIRGDERLLLTVRLNLQNILDRAEWLHSKGLTERQITKITEAVTTTLHALPSVNKRWNKPWWNTDVATPVIS
jgi:hypothetical protein